MEKVLSVMLSEFDAVEVTDKTFSHFQEMPNAGSFDATARCKPLSCQGWAVFDGEKVFRHEGLPIGRRRRLPRGPCGNDVSLASDCVAEKLFSLNILLGS